MADERWEQVKRLVEGVIAAGAEHRAALTEGLDRGLREEVESLLEAYDTSFLERMPAVTDSASPAAAPIPEVTRDEISKSVGPYRILGEIGEGGMGVVYEAEQEKPVRRLVALKLIKWGLDTKAVVARFESERQALALMNHPNIARIFDAGATPEGRPYFAMELAHGEPITTYCDKHRLKLKERLALFVQVCEGVQHAHQKGIIHRDIKPSNILVTLQDAKPVPKILDYGVAKATSRRLTERSVYTEIGQWVGTPAYMSPEQLDVTGLDIDTRADVYSLGVVLYELLSGAQPFDATELRKAGLDAFRRMCQSGSRLMTDASISETSSPRNAFRPVSISYRTVPNAKTSVRPSTFLPFACSGDMYPAVPRITPTRVAPRVTVGDVEVGGSPSSPAWTSAFARPKSRTLIFPSSFNLMFAGFRSR